MANPETVVSLGRLLRLTEAIHDGRGLDDLLSGLIDRAAELPGVDTVRVLLLDPEQGVLVAQGGIFPHTDDDESVVPSGVGFAGRIAQDRQPLLVDDLKDSPVFSQALRVAGIRSAVGVPLLAGEHLVGVMHIGSRKPGTFSGDSIPVLEAVAERVALTIQAIRAERELATSERRFRILFEDAPLGICMVSLRQENLGAVVMANRALSRVIGIPADELVGKRLIPMLLEHDQPSGEQGILQLARGDIAQYTAERQIDDAGGGSRWLHCNVCAVPEDGSPQYAIAYMEDISARKASEVELARRALTDPVTGLANRHRVMDHLTLALRQQARVGGVVGVLYIDLDHFKDINDDHGHETGDRVLREVAQRLNLTVRAADTAGRLGGDEFIVVSPGLTDAGELAAIASRLLQYLSVTAALPGGLSVDLGVSIGSAIGDRQTSPDELVRRADVAMYEAKRRGRGRVYAYSQVLDESSRRRLQVEDLIRGALERDWFTLLYQPIVDLGTGAPVSVEALLRINHPEHGMLLPTTFIDFLEESELAEPVEKWVLTQACRQFRSWVGRGLQGVTINVSGRLAASGALTEAVLAATESAGIAPSHVTVEMTERVLVQGGPAVIADLSQLTSAGVAIAIDDFGTGWSSLTYLQRFPVTTVKVDRSFVAGLGVSARDDAIVGAVTALGTVLGLNVIAEGVETERQAEVLHGFGCRQAQGFLFSRPAPPEQIQLPG